MAHNNLGHTGNDDRLETELSEKIQQRVIEHTNHHRYMLINKYKELLCNLIKYKDLNGEVLINSSLIETYLRHGYSVVFGRTALGYNTVIGYLQIDNIQANGTGFDFLNNYSNIDLTKMKYIIPEIERLDTYTALNDYNSDGNCIVLRNKYIEFQSDFDMLTHYCNKLAEIEKSRYSLVIQAKAVTVLAGDENDIDLNNMVNRLYNAIPYMTVYDAQDINDKIVALESAGAIPALITELKREYENIEGEQNARLGFSSLNNSKESGVSEVEITQNSEYSDLIKNTYYNIRQHAFDLYNKRFSTNIKVV